MLLLCRPHWGGERVYGKSERRISTAQESEKPNRDGSSSGSINLLG